MTVAWDGTVIRPVPHIDARKEDCPGCQAAINDDDVKFGLCFVCREIHSNPTEWPDELLTVPEDDGGWDDFEATFAGLFSEAFGILCDRQAKYGPDNITRQGIYGVIKRIADDKMQRILRAVNGTIHNGTAIVEIAAGDDEDTFEDGLIDFANYALIALALHRGLWGRELTSQGARLELRRG